MLRIHVLLSPSFTQNLSSLPGFMGPPTADDRFTTTSASSFTGGGNASQVRAAGTPRHLAQFKTMSESHTKDVFGMGGPSLETVTETSAHAMNSGAQEWPRARTPRFVNGGAFRNASTVPLDKNNQRLDGTAVLHDFATTSGTAWWPGGEVERPMSRYERPQKNTSTYIATSMAVHTARTPEHKPREHYGHVNPRTESLTSRPKTSANQFREPPKGFSASSHFLTTYKQHFPEPSGKLVVPQGKGSVDRSISSIPMGSDFDARPMPSESHSHSIFVGAQLDELRHTCASRGTLGVRGGKKLPRDSSGAPAGFFQQQTARGSDLRLVVK